MVLCRFLLILTVLSTITVAFKRCPGSSTESYLGGTMDCMLPKWSYGRYLHEIKYPSWYPEVFYFLQKDKVHINVCKQGTCFKFSQQKCVDFSVWTSDCKLSNPLH